MKPDLDDITPKQVTSRPSRGAWVETLPHSSLMRKMRRRAPRGARGLKPIRARRALDMLCRAPRGARGLKRAARGRSLGC